MANEVKPDEADARRTSLTPQEIQALVSLHSTMAEQLNARLSESHRFFGVLILALTAYGYVIWDPQLPLNRFKLTLASSIIYVVTLWALWYLAALGYAFRFLQFPMHKIGKVLGWSKYGLGSGTIAQGFWRWSWLLPGIYHAHLAGLLAVMMIVLGVFAWKWWQIPAPGVIADPHIEALAMLAVGILWGVCWAVGVNLHYVRKYEDKKIKGEQLAKGVCKDL